MRQIRRLIVPILITILSAIPSSARAQRLAPWETTLQDHPLVIERARELAAALREGDVLALSAQFAPGKLRLLAGRAAAPAKLYAHSQACAMMADYLSRRPGLELEFDYAKYEAAAGLAHIAFAYRFQESGRARPRRDRIVAVYGVRADSVYLVELRCP